MKGIFWIILALSLCGSIMILELLALKPLIHNRVTKAFQYYIWVVVILRLMIPFSTDINLIGATADFVKSKIEEVSPAGNVSDQMQTSMEVNTTKPEKLTFQGDSNTPDYNVADNRMTENSMIGNNTANYSIAAPGMEKSMDTTASTIAAANTSLGSIQSNNTIKEILTGLWVIWLGGLFIALFRVFYQYFYSIKKLRRNTAPVKNPDICIAYENCCNELRLRKHPSLYSSSIIKTPIMVGFLSPKIILPEQQYNQSELRYALLHELNHYKKHDILYKWTVQIITCIHWFNPLVYIMAAKIKQAGELACDEAVINSLDLEDRKEYGLTLINLAASIKPAGNALCLNESKKHLKERLTAILKSNQSVKRVSAISCILLLIVISTAAFSYVNEPKEDRQLTTEDSIRDEVESILKDVKNNALFMGIGNDHGLNIEDDISNLNTDNELFDFDNSLEEFINNIVDASLYYGTNDIPENPFTYEQLEKMVYPKAELIEKDFDNVDNLDISLVAENVILNQGGDKVHIKYYQWYDNQYDLSLENGRLTFKNGKDQYLTTNVNTDTNTLLSEALKHMNYDMNPEDPKDYNGTVVITVPNGMTLKDVRIDLVSGNLTISKLSADTVILENVCGNIDINESYVADLSVSVVSGKINADTVRGNSAYIENVSAHTLITDCQFSDMKVNNISGGIDIILDDISAYHINYSGFGGRIKVGSISYENEVNLNTKAPNKLTINAFSSPVSIEESGSSME